jgi:hypothetical protein
VKAAAETIAEAAAETIAEAAAETIAEAAEIKEGQNNPLFSFQFSMN